jgi:hypothetical protein
MLVAQTVKRRIGNTDLPVFLAAAGHTGLRAQLGKIQSAGLPSSTPVLNKEDAGLDLAENSIRDPPFILTAFTKTAESDALGSPHRPGKLPLIIIGKPDVRHGASVRATDHPQWWSTVTVPLHRPMLPVPQGGHL